MSVTQSHSAVVLRTFTFAFTDIEGSTKLWDEQPEAMRAALARHDEIVREAIEGGGGRVFKTIGDAFCAVFVEASDALDAMAAAMRELEREPWAPETPIRVRMAVHTGEAEVRQNDYFGPPLNRVARLLAIGHGGQILVSKATAEGLEGHDLLDLGLHSLKDLADPERVYQLLDPWLATDFPELRSVSSAPRHNIPESLTTFVGRAEVSARLEGVLDEARLVSLTGAGGCGKTRLAIHVARRVLERFEDGVWFVELASVMSGDFVPAAVAAVVGVREEAGKSMTESLGTALRTKKVLIVLDNCEHLLDACAQLVLGLLEQCPGVWAMTTTREAIGVPGERVFTVPSLSLPDPGETLGRADAESYEAVALFLARAQGQGRAIEPTESNLALVGSICRQLDGIPFAIELSAARTNVLSLESIHAKLDQRFQLLTGGSRTALPRQQTLRSLIDWSYDLLNPAEQSTLRRFGVFSGGCDLEAAESLFDADALDLLSSLADKSLLQIDRSSEPVRFTILETVRQYAIERLVDAGEAGYWRARHAQHFAEFVTRAALEFTGPDQLAWYSRVDREHDNLRLALDQGEPYALTIVAGIWRYWLVRGHYTEGYERASQALDRSATTGPDRIAAVRGAGVLANFKGDPGLAGSLFEQGLALADEIGDVSGKAAFLSSIGNLETQFGNIAAAVERFSEALRIYEVLGDRSGMARVLNNLALAEQWLGELESARGHYRQCLDMNRQSGDTTMIALSHHNLGWIAFEFNELDDAVEEYEASLAMRRELGERGGVADTLTNLGDVRLVEKRFDDAEALYAEARAIYGEIADVRGVALTEFGLSAVAGARGDDAVERRLLEGAAAVLHGLGEQRSLGAVLGSLAFNHARSGRVDDAVRAFGAIEAHRVASGYHVPREVREQHEVQAAVLAGMVGNTERFSAFFAEGQGMSLSDVVSTFVSLVERGS